MEAASLLARAARVIPGGASAAGRRVFREVIVKTRGAYLWNSEGKRYIDYLLDYGPIVVGHSDARVNAAALRAAEECDLNWVGPHPLEVELAEKIVALSPSAEKVVFVTSGSDALLHAVHVARAATGRRRLLKFHGSFVGWHDPLARGANFDVRPGEVPSPSDPNAGGIDPRAIEDVIVLDWNDAGAVREAFEAYGGEIAAVVCEPYVLSYGCVPPAAGFLELLRELTVRNGALLVFDEVKTGFRFHLGGYQVVAGVTPDLTAFGKALGNGYTIAALAGRRDLMDLLGVAVALDGTHYANPYALAAALETICILEDGGIERLAVLGERLREGLARVFHDAGAEAVVTGFGSGFMVNWRREPPVTFREAAQADFERAEAFRLGMLERGVLLPPLVITDSRLCLATSEADIDETVEAAAAVLRDLRL
ncbi:MAG TPA: aminotransferase class III-fold pyridoxal phosphate-dependent enzyme [Dehalococcoidia bacterium]|nr:aminotransferase class III-fold pyridoxal phosphate-dependent enzyme [Dehalococcoidia bacterium]